MCFDIDWLEGLLKHLNRTEMTTQKIKALMRTNLDLPGQVSRYQGKVRDVYRLNDDRLVMVASDRISAFDVVLPEGIPYKGQVLNQIANHFLDLTSDIVPNWKTACPDPQVTVGIACDPYRVEMVIRGYLTGHAWRQYSAGKRMLCGVPLPEGLREHDRLPNPIITPATKADEGHDEDISREEIIAQGIIPEEEYVQLEQYTRQLFQRGTEFAAERGLILVDTKYEFGKHDGEIYLIDEIHTPDSSRYFYSEGYEERQENGAQQKQLSKEFVRQWLISNGFQGLEGQVVPLMDEARVQAISERYIELYENITGKAFEPADTDDIEARIGENINNYLRGL
jgi:phosphoribosylaminoimidazole-succinocarboxamide synthase